MAPALYSKFRTSLPRSVHGRAAAVKYAVKERLGEPRCMPDYIGIGTIKGGSTSLWHYLAQHPQVLAASEKQVRYFDYFSYLGPAWYRSMFRTERERRELSAKLGMPVIAGEFSPSYLSHPTAPPRAKALVPNVKLLVVLRNPVDRAYSHWQHSSRKGGETVTDFAQALALEESRLGGEREKIFTDPFYFPRAYGDFSYRLRGRYAEHLETWLAEFPREQMLVVRSESLFEDPKTILNEDVFPFLGISSETDAIKFRAQNVGGYESGIPQAVREELSEYFAPHNERLEALLGMKFNWT